MVVLVTCCGLSIGYGSHGKSRPVVTVLPLVISIAFFLIADIDTPRRGVIRVSSQNLLSLASSLRQKAVL